MRGNHQLNVELNRGEKGTEPLQKRKVIQNGYGTTPHEPHGRELRTLVYFLLRCFFRFFTYFFSGESLVQLRKPYSPCMDLSI